VEEIDIIVFGPAGDAEQAEAHFGLLLKAAQLEASQTDARVAQR
jgi:hypothetical protein